MELSRLQEWRRRIHTNRAAAAAASLHSLSPLTPTPSTPPHCDTTGASMASLRLPTFRTRPLGLRACRRSPDRPLSLLSLHQRHRPLPLPPPLFFIPAPHRRRPHGTTSSLHTQSLASNLPPNPPPASAHITTHSSLLSSLRALLFGTSIALTLFFGYLYVTDTRSGIHVVAPVVLKYLYEDAEDAHEIGNAWLKGLYWVGLHPRERSGSDVDGREGKGADLEVKVRVSL